MQFHPLVRGGVLPALGPGRLVDAVGLQHQIVVVEPPQGQPPLHLEPLAVFHLGDDGLGLLPLHEAGHPDGAGQIGDIKAHHPRLAAGQLPVLYIKYLALHQHAAHIQRQLAQGAGTFPAADFAVNLLYPLFSTAGTGGVRAHHLPAHSLHLGLQPLGLFLFGRCGGRFLRHGHFRRWRLLLRGGRRRLRLNGFRLWLIHRHRGRAEPKGPLQHFRRLGQDFLGNGGSADRRLHGPLGLVYPHLDRITAKSG